VTVIARALKVSRRCCYRPVCGAGPDPTGPQTGTQRPGFAPPGANGQSRHPIASPLPIDWQTCALGPEHLAVEVALHVLARRHGAAGYRKLTARARRAGYRVNKKRVQRLLRAWGFTRARRRPHPKAQGRPFEIAGPNELWQTDLTAVWCGEDGWGYFTAVLDCYCRSILGWAFTPRCRALDVIPALEAPVATAFPSLERRQRVRRTRLQDPQGGMRLAQRVRQLPGGPRRDHGLGRGLQPRAATHVARRPDPGRSPRRGPHPTQSCSLTVNESGGHYAFLTTWARTLHDSALPGRGRSLIPACRNR
jgi:hypothetical protein